MAGPAPKDPSQRRRRNRPARGEVLEATATSWQHGPVPGPPDGLLPASLDAWSIWFASWPASFWTAGDVPALRLLVRLYDQVERGEFQRAAEVRVLMDTYGITAKGQRARRWGPPRFSEPVHDPSEVRGLCCIGRP
jgi:hypothetical protein